MVAWKIFVLAVVIVAASASDRKVAFTRSNVECMSKCVPYKNTQDRYCYLGYGYFQWDYCTNTDILANQYFTSLYYNQNKRLCLSDCRRAGYGFYWCFTSEDFKEWDYCSPAPNYDYKAERCMKSCDFYHYHEYYTCPITKNWLYPDTYIYCSPNPNKPAIINQRERDLRQIHHIDRQNLKNHAQCRTVLNVANEPLTKKSTPFYSLRDILGSYESFLPIQAIAEFNRPTVHYTSVVTNDNVEVVITMRAILSRSTIPCVGNCRPGGHPGGTDQRMRELNQQPYDEIGHMLALSLGGPNVLNNLIPQHQTTNRNVGNNRAFPNWFRIERRLRQQLLNNRSIEFIDWQLVNLYDGDLNSLSVRRPFGFGLFYTIHLYGGATEESGDCIFDNDF